MKKFYAAAVLVLAAFIAFIILASSHTVTPYIYRDSSEDLFLCDVVQARNKPVTPKFRYCKTESANAVTTTTCTFLQYGKQVTWSEYSTFVCHK